MVKHNCNNKNVNNKMVGISRKDARGDAAKEVTD